MVDDAHALNRELTALLVRAGERAGYQALPEYPLPGGRLDVVWAVTSPVPDVDGPLPVVGFEIESSWRTRKHVKGDLLNLQDAGVALGVIVLAGETARDHALRRFAEALVVRPGPRILIWTTEDVRALTGEHPAPSLRLGGGTLSDVSPNASATPDVSAPSPSVRTETSHAGKYADLWRWLRERPAEQREVRATFAEVEQVLGFPLPASSRSHLPHWYGYDGSAVSRAIRDAGWKATQVSLEGETVVFVRE